MNRLKKSSIWKIVAALLLIFLLVIFYKKMITPKLSQSQYSEVRNDGCYHLVMQNWTGEKEYGMKLQKGDVLHIEWRIEEGESGISVLLDAERSIYKADHVSNGDTPQASFGVTVPEDGEYILHAYGRSGTGEITIKKE